MLETYPDRARHVAEHLMLQGIVSRIWKRDAALWTDPSAPDRQRFEAAVRNRLGWLTTPSDMSAELDRVHAFVADIHRDGIRTVYLLGMGGSSLCAEVLAAIAGRREDRPELVVLDTTDEKTVTAAAVRLQADSTLVLVASKSGGTVEVSALEAYFRDRMRSAIPQDRIGRHFAAITDPETVLERLAHEQGYRVVFRNPPDIGGRFSALSLFGLVPAAIVGLDTRDLLAKGAWMAESCREATLANPGLQLGAFMGAAALEGRDKLTLMLAPSFLAMGPWIEQLVAESTGKHGKGVLPIVDESPAGADAYDDDRAFVFIETEEGCADMALEDALQAAGHPVLRICTSAADLGGEFFRWEFATAVAGVALGLNPFDEPNVQEAKDRTKHALSTFVSTGRLSEPVPAAMNDSVAIFGGARPGVTPAQAVRALIDSARSGDYVAFLSYLPQSGVATGAFNTIRQTLRARRKVATTLGVGPRYLHSTGQYHKGGPNRGICVLVTADDESQTPVPGKDYSFGVLKRAQALGDFEALEAHGRRVLRIHLLDRRRDHGEVLQELFAEAGF